MDLYGFIIGFPRVGLAVLDNKPYHKADRTVGQKLRAMSDTLWL